MQRAPNGGDEALREGIVCKAHQYGRLAHACSAYHPRGNRVFEMDVAAARARSSAVAMIRIRACARARRARGRGREPESPMSSSLIRKSYRSAEAAMLSTLSRG